MEEIQTFLSFQLFKYKNVSVSLFDIIVIGAIYVIALFAVRLFRFFMNRSVEKRDWINASTAYALQKLAAYVAYVIASLFSLQVVGINLNILLAGSAALLVGFGFGIQQIFNDFISGLILLFGGTVRVGDIVEFNNTVGRIIEIDFRTSRIKTRAGITIIVPNSKLVSDNVINWTSMDDLTRFEVTVGVAYGSDTKLVSDILIEVASKHEAVEQHIPVRVQFTDFGDSSLNFKVLFWARNNWEIEFVRSEIRFEIDRRFREAGIKIPFPQRDVHITNNG